MLGVGEGWLYTAAAAWVVDVTPEERRGETIGIFGMAIWLGLSLGPPIGEALRAIGGFDLVWAFAAVAPAVGAVVAARTPEDRHVASTPSESVLLPRGALLPGLALGCAVIGFAAMQGFVILMLDDRGVAHGATVFTAFAVAVAVTRFLLSWLPDRIGAVRTAAIAAAGHASGLAILAVAHSLPVALVAAVVQGVGYSLLFPALALLAVQRVGEHSRGAALGFFTAFFDAGMGLGAPLAGAMAVLLGYGGMFLIAAAFSLAGGVLMVRGAASAKVVAAQTGSATGARTW